MISRFISGRQAPAGLPFLKCSATAHLTMLTPSTIQRLAVLRHLSNNFYGRPPYDPGIQGARTAFVWKNRFTRLSVRCRAGHMGFFSAETHLMGKAAGPFTSRRIFAPRVKATSTTRGATTCARPSVRSDDTGTVGELATRRANASARNRVASTAVAPEVHGGPFSAGTLGSAVKGIYPTVQAMVHPCAAYGECTASATAKTRELVRENYAKAVGAWLLGCSAMVFGMVCWGGYTRLTKSGLSMTEWRFQGTWLPTSEKSWEEQFTKYKETPEYRDVHYGMSLVEFKKIYCIEWFHRMLGRATGGLFVGGLVIFSVARALSPLMILRLTCLGALGAAQGQLGWWMVKSGFSEPTTEVKTPRVSPYRLAAHLLAAMTLYSLTLWQALSLLHASRVVATSTAAVEATVCSATATALKKFQIRAAAAGALMCTTLASGAFVAGNDAGRVYNTWPKMHNHWVPPEVLRVRQNWKKIFENLEVVQFNHRMLAYASTAISGLLYFSGRNLPLPLQFKKALILLPAATTCQALLGIATLLSRVPTELGVLHQAGGMIVLTVLLYLLQTASRLRGLPLRQTSCVICP